MLPIHHHPSTWHTIAPIGAAPVANFARNKSIYVVDVDEYDLYRSLLYALGARSVANKKLAHVEVIVHGEAAPAAARSKYPNGQFVPAQAVLPLFRQEVDSFGGFVRALRASGFTVRNPSDEGDPEFDYFAGLPLLEGSLHATLLAYLGSSPFIRRFVAPQSFPIDTRSPEYIEFPVPGTNFTWYYLWNSSAWARVSAQRGDGDYPLEIKGPQLLGVAPLFWTQSTGMYFHEYPHIDSVTGLFIQAGVDARTGLVDGVAISRVWT